MRWSRGSLRRIATLRSERRTLREIAEVLNREGRKPRRADVWSPKQPKLSSLGRMEVAA
jgi:hypothetical protein